MFCGKRRRELERFETSTIVVDQHMDDINISAKRTCDGVSSMPAFLENTNGIPYMSGKLDNPVPGAGISGLNSETMGASYKPTNQSTPAAGPVQGQRSTSCQCSVCTGTRIVGPYEVVPDGILSNFNNNCNTVQSMEVIPDVDMQMDSSSPVQLTPARRRSCARCVAGEPGHITHILE